MKDRHIGRIRVSGWKEPHTPDPKRDSFTPNPLSQTPDHEPVGNLAAQNPFL